MWKINKTKLKKTKQKEKKEILKKERLQLVLLSDPFINPIDLAHAKHYFLMLEKNLTIK